MIYNITFNITVTEKDEDEAIFQAIQGIKKGLGTVDVEEVGE